MTIDVDILGDLWLTAKEYIPSKDREAAAEHVVSIVADSGITDQQLKEFGGFDSYLKNAVDEILYEDSDEEEDDYGSDDY